MNNAVKEEAECEKSCFEESEKKRIFYDPTANNVNVNGDHATENMPQSTVDREHGPLSNAPSLWKSPFRSKFNLFKFIFINIKI